MTPEQAREIDRLEFEADCRRAREQAHAHVAMKRAEDRRKVASWLGRQPPALKFNTPITPPNGPKLYEFEGKALPLSEWAKISGHALPTLRYRLSRGMPFAQALTTQTLKRGVSWDRQT